MDADQIARTMITGLLDEMREEAAWDQAVGNKTSSDQVAVYGKHRDAERREAELIITVRNTVVETELCQAFRWVCEEMNPHAVTVYGPIPHGSFDDSAWRIHAVVPMTAQSFI